MMMATDDATLNAGDKKNSTHKRNTREEIKRKLEVRDWTERKVHEKLISIGSFFFVFSKKKVCCSCSICHLLPGSLNVLFQSETYGWWEKVKAEEKQNRSRIRDLHVCSFEIIKAKYKLPWTTHTFPFSEFEYFRNFPFFPLIVVALFHTVMISSGKEDFTWLWLYAMWPSINFNATKIKYFKGVVSCFNLS